MSTSSQDTHGCAKAAGRPKASEVEARMQELIDSAGSLFLKHGYTRVSLESIARQAHVAVRTIYVKFGGKAGLLNAVIQSKRDRYLNVRDMQTDERPFKVIVDDFARHFLQLLNSPEAMSMQRVVIAEAASNPELAHAFYEAGPRPTRQMLERFFARPDIRAQLQPDLPFDQLPTHLINCITGDQMGRFLFPQPEPAAEEARRKLDERLAFFYRAVLRETPAG
jgi:TetR/AcrR family transcriptional regulator, mexJK operon transcriptional repressor